MSTKTKTRVSVEQRLAALDLLAQYVHRVDDREMEDCRALFHPECVVIFGGKTYTGTAEIKQWQDLVAAQAPGCHVLACPEIYRTQDGVLMSVADFALLKKPDGPWSVVASGRWVDCFDESGDTLTFSRREISYS